MNLLNYLFFVRKRLLYKVIMLIFNIIIIVLAFTLLSYVFVECMYINNFKYEAIKYLNKDVNMCGTAFISLPTEPAKNIEERKKLNERWIKCLDEISNTDAIESIGVWDPGYPMCLSKSARDSEKIWENMISISKKNPHFFTKQELMEMGLSYDTCIDTVTVSPKVLALCNIKTTNGPIEIKDGNKRDCLYLGYNFKDVPIGTIFYNEEEKKEYEVAGILEKDARLLDGDILATNGYAQGKCSNFMDNAILHVDYSDPFTGFSSLNLFSVKDGYKLEDGEKVIKEISDKYGYSSYCGTYMERVNTLASKQNMMLNDLIKMAVLIFIVSIFIVLITQLLLSDLKRNELGIWLVCGLTSKNLFLIMTIENAIKYGLAAIMSYVIVYFRRSGDYYGIDTTANNRYGYIFTQGLIPSLTIASIVLAIGISFITIRIIKKQSIREQLSTK